MNAQFNSVEEASPAFLVIYFQTIASSLDGMGGNIVNIKVFHHDSVISANIHKYC